MVWYSIVGYFQRVWYFEEAFCNNKFLWFFLWKSILTSTYMIKLSLHCGYICSSSMFQADTAVCKNLKALSKALPSATTKAAKETMLATSKRSWITAAWWSLRLSGSGKTTRQFWTRIHLPNVFVSIIATHYENDF